MTTIEMQNVWLGYSRKEVLKDISFKVIPGEIVGLIGPNGCGKSTIIRALSRVISPYQGKILLDKKDITCIPRQELARKLGVVPQIPLLPSTFTAFEAVLMGRNPHLGLFQHEGIKELDIAWRAMEKTKIQHLARRRVGELSGGEIQCVVVARVLAQETKAILLDEPTANLDIGRQIEILDLFNNLCVENNLTILAALHDLNLASQYCARLVLIKDGHIYAQGTPGEVITSQNIKEVYGVNDCVYSHPINGRPTVLVKGSKSYNPGKVMERDIV
jgi:iron complex transport system ATP-binding protein